MSLSTLQVGEFIRLKDGYGRHSNTYNLCLKVDINLIHCLIVVNDIKYTEDNLSDLLIIGIGENNPFDNSFSINRFHRIKKDAISKLNAIYESTGKILDKQVVDKIIKYVIEKCNCKFDYIKEMEKLLN